MGNSTDRSRSARGATADIDNYILTRHMQINTKVFQTLVTDYSGYNAEYVSQRGDYFGGFSTGSDTGHKGPPYARCQGGATRARAREWGW